ncbi:MAG: DNA repair protein RadC [Candidatus Obscuribacterales bacterium]|nr:DNA repair protein RadC [Candidatus Obscuribacterales bacterium]
MAFTKALNYELPTFRLRLVRESGSKRRPITIRQPADLAAFLQPLAMAAEEHFVACHLNAKSQVIGVHEVSHGTLSESLVHPREVFKAAILSNSYSIIVCHNHPSGATISPSREDFDTTRQLISAGNLIGIPVVDHVIVGPESKSDWYSFREHQPELWSAAL